LAHISAAESIHASSTTSMVIRLESCGIPWYYSEVRAIM